MERLKPVFYKKNLQNRLLHKIHVFCLIDFNGAENVNFVCQMVLQVFSYKKQTLHGVSRQSVISNLALTEGRS